MHPRQNAKSFGRLLHGLAHLKKPVLELPPNEGISVLYFFLENPMENNLSRALASKKVLPKILPRSFLQIENFCSADKCAHWSRVIKEQQINWRACPGVPNLFFFGNNWFSTTSGSTPEIYFSQAQEAQQLVDSQLPDFKETFIESHKFLTGPDPTIQYPARPRSQNLNQSWCEVGIDILTSSDRDCRHWDHAGLSPYPSSLNDSKTFAYTAILSIETPEMGAGLEIWNEIASPGQDLSKLSDETRQILKYQAGTLTLIDAFLPHGAESGLHSPQKPYRIVGIIHYLFLTKPYPHWEYWY